MNEAALILAALKLLQTSTAFIANFNATASPAQIKALIDEARSRGETIDLDDVDKAIADMNRSAADLRAKIDAQLSGG